MNRVLKKGDVILIVVHYGLAAVVAELFAGQDAEREDMMNTHSVIFTEGKAETAWTISPADLYLVEMIKDKTGEGVPNQFPDCIVDGAEALSNKAVKRCRDRGYFWELRCRVEIPTRSRFPKGDVQKFIPMAR